MRYRPSIALRIAVMFLIIGITSAMDVEAQVATSWTLGVGGEFDSNVFLLSPGRRGDLAAPSAGNTLSGRFTDMPSASDLRTMVDAAVTFKMDGAGGRPFEITPSVDYSFYAQNSARREWTLGLQLRQNLPHESGLRIKGSFSPAHFRKNYLVDAIDSDGSGSITPGERVYEAGTFSEATVRVDYRHRLVKSTKTRPFGAFASLVAGIEARSYKDPFSARNRSGPTFGVSLDVDFSTTIALAVDYRFASLSNTPTPQILILDEVDAGQDLNGNGFVTDADVRTLTNVDRSRTENTISATVEAKVNRFATVEIDFQQRWRNYTSSELLDIAHNGGRAVRSRFGGTTKLRLARRVRGTVGGWYAIQTLNRESDLTATGDIDDYSRGVLRFGIEFRQ